MTTTMAALLKRVERIEAKQHVGAPLRIIANYPVGNAAARDALTNWRQWVADGRATVKGEVLWLMQPPLSVEEWIARYTPAEGPMQ
jgi:hypothetical protein